MIEDRRIASIPYEDRWIDEAADRLQRYNNVPFIVGFLSRHGFDPDAYQLVRDEIDEIKRSIRSPDHPLRFDDLVAYLDELKAYGRQFVFLWRIKPGEERYLEQLRRRDTIERRLGGELTSLLDQPRLIWESETPALSEVDHQPGGDFPTLCFKWVATRRYWVIGPPDNPNAPPIAVQRSQRAVAFFCIDLGGGDCTLRIQSLPNRGDGLPSRKEEYERFRAEVEKYVDLDRFSPVLIEPIARSWLYAHDLPVSTWDVVRTNGESLRGGIREPADLLRLLVLIGEFFAKQVRLKWDSAQRVVNGPLFFTLDGQADMVDFNGIADASRIDFLLDRIRNRPPITLAMKELRELAERFPQHLRIFAAMDHRFMARTQLRVTVKELADELWYPRQTIQEVFAIAAREFPSKFRSVGKQRDVLEMSNRLRLREGGLVDTLKRAADGHGSPQAKALVKPAMTVAFLLVLLLLQYLASHLLEKFFEDLTGLPFVVAQVAFVGVLGIAYAGVTYGSRSVQAFAGSILTFTRSVAHWARFTFGNGDGDGDGSPGVRALEAVYLEWRSAAGQRVSTWSVERASSS